MERMAKISDTEAALVWRIVEPGVLGMPATSITIKYVTDTSVPFRVLWHGKMTTGAGCCTTLEAAKRTAAALMAELMEMGLEP